MTDMIKLPRASSLLVLRWIIPTCLMNCLLDWRVLLVVKGRMLQLLFPLSHPSSPRWFSPASTHSSMPLIVLKRKHDGNLSRC